VKHFASSYFAIVVNCRYDVYRCSQNPRRDMKAQHEEKIPRRIYFTSLLHTPTHC